MADATLRQCAVLAGGLGTRLGAITAATPKPLLDVAGRPFLFWLLRELSRFGVEEVLLLTGHLAGCVTDSVADLVVALPRRLRVTVSQEPLRAGTGGALFHAAAKLESRFLLCNGDSIADANLAPLLAAFAQDPPSTLMRMLVRRVPDAARYGVVVLDGDRVVAFRAQASAPEGPALINAGIYAVDRRILAHTAQASSLEQDILPLLAADGALRASATDGWFIDIGVPEDYARAQTELPARLRRPALFLDRDGTINVDHGYVGSRDRFHWIDGAQSAIRRATEAGWHVFIVTNQSGVARGYYDEASVDALHRWLGESLRGAGGTIDDIRYCPFHPQAPLPQYRRESEHRKPGGGMIRDLLRAWDIDPARAILVGDRPSDVAAASAAGVTGFLFPSSNLDAFVAPLLQSAAASG